MRRNRFGIVIPVFNEEKRIDLPYLTEISLIDDVLLIFVDDGSSDSTLSLLLEGFCNIQNVSILSYPNNLGKANAVRLGWLELLKYEDIEIFGLLDVDGAFSIDDIKIFLRLVDELLLGQDASYQQFGEMDALWSSRIQLSGRSVVRSKKRFVLGRILANIVGVFFKDLPWDTQSGMKFYLRTDCFTQILQIEFQNRWLFEIEMHLLLKQVNSKGFRIWEEPLRSWIDVEESKVNFREQLRILGEFVNLLYRFKIKGKGLS